MKLWKILFYKLIIFSVKLKKIYHKSSRLHPMVGHKLGHVISDAVRQKDDNTFVGWKLFGEFQSHGDSGAAATTAQQSFMFYELSCSRERLAVVAFYPRINDISIEYRWNEVVAVGTIKIVVYSAANDIS